jgi:NADP-dependent 3-hydroxy acid dehydrogenase YdfG
LINSFSGHRVPNGFGGKTHFYSATKFAVTALLEGWRQELRDHVTKNNIRIGQLCPGVVVTEFSQTMNGGDKASADALYSTMECLEAEDMADCVKYILQAPIRMQIHDILVRPTQQKM